MSNQQSAPLVASGKSQFKKYYVNPKPKFYQGVVVDVNFKSQHPFTFDGNTTYKDAVTLVFQLKGKITEEMIVVAKKEAGLEAELSEKDRELIGKRPIIATKALPLIFSKKAGLRKNVEAVTGVTYPDDYNFDFEKEGFIGKNAGVLVTAKQATNGKTYINIGALSAWDSEEGELMLPDGFIRQKDRIAANEAKAAAQVQKPEVVDDEIPFN